MTPTKREAALRLAEYQEKLAFAVQAGGDSSGFDLMDTAALLRELAAEPVQEPECQYAKDVGMPEYRCAGKCQYAAPQQRKPLSDEQIDAVTREQWGQLLGSMMVAHRAFARAIERAHGITGEQK